MYRELTELKEYYLAYGIFCLSSVIFSAFFASSYSHSIFNTMEIIQRFFSGILCVLLIFYELWPVYFKRYKKLYWYLVLTYTLPYLSTSMILISNFNNFFVINFTLSIFLLAILSDWLNFIIILVVGVTLSLTIYILNFGVEYLSIDHKLLETLYILIFSSIIVYFFCRKQQNIQILKLKQIYLLASSIAHEVRTPLAILLGNLSLLEARKAHFEERDQEVIYKIKKNVGACHNSIDTILYSFKEEKSIQLKIENISRLMLDVVKTYPFTAEEKLLLKVNINKSKHCVMINKLLLTQVIDNLIKNALDSINHASKGGIFISLKTQKKFVRIYVKDTGIGMTKDVLDNMFKPFITNKNKGNGVGLAYSKIIISKMQGSIKCFSIYKKYTLFVIEIPIVY